MNLFTLFSFAVSVCIAHADPSQPNSIFEAKQYTKKVKEVTNGVLYEVSAPDNTTLNVMHIYGDAKQRGFAHGALIAEEAYHFLTVSLAEFYKEQADELPLGDLPEWLQPIIKELAEKDAPAAFSTALNWVFQKQQAYTMASPANVMDEMQGMVDGMCSVIECDDKAALLETVHATNMLPELIKMQCSMLGAWGAATTNNKLVQMRSLDFGGGPFADYNVLVVSHPTDSEYAFASLSFPGFVGAVTGFSQKIGQSEKVDDVTGGPRPKGSYDGQAVALVIRDMLQFASTKEEAVQIAQSANRTWSVWLGVGDYASQEFRAMLYTQESAVAYDDKTLPSLTNQTAFHQVAYIDKHPQPSPHPDLPALIKQYYGNLSTEVVAQNIPRLTQSGDVHIAIYDFDRRRALIAQGTTDASGDYTRYAYEAPYLAFDMQALWDEPKPTLRQ